jgi:hypothetical protein
VLEIRSIMICPTDIIRAQLKEHIRQNETRILHIHLIMQQQCTYSPINLTLVTLHSVNISLQNPNYLISYYARFVCRIQRSRPTSYHIIYCL